MIGIIVPIFGLCFAFALAVYIKNQDAGTQEMKEISEHIKKGAMVFLNHEYRVLIAYVVIVSLLLAIFIGSSSVLAFVLGALFSALAGNIGMRIATTANVRTANACRKNITKSLRIAFSSGAVMGFTVVSLALLGIVVLSYFYPVEVLYAFGFGASSIALFARVGGGIYTKAADVGADLVGKVEKSIPEDDPRNPAVIADNVGDNVGDVAGMGADLFESYADAIIAALAIAIIFQQPLIYASLGIIASILGCFFVRGKNPSMALNKGIFFSALFMAIFGYIVSEYYFKNLNPYYSLLTGLITGILIGLITEYFTSPKYRPTINVANAAQTGSATNIIAGFSTGMLSTIIPVLLVASAIVVSYKFSGMYGIAISAIGMLSTLGITLATDCYGPVADNAAGISEMAKLGKSTRRRAEELDAVGNTTAAIGKGFAIGSAALTAIALFVAYAHTVKLNVISIIEPNVVAGMLIGAMLPFFFSSLTMSAVGKAAFDMVKEVRTQFKNKLILQGKKKPDYERCIEISTKAAIREMIAPAMIAILAPILVGFVLGNAALGGMLAGAIITGFLLAVTMANAGATWDNAKKYVEEGNLGGKGSDVHKATVVGDTVGDPFKDTSGPSLNILIKLMSIISLVIAPLL